MSGLPPPPALHVPMVSSGDGEIGCERGLVRAGAHVVHTRSGHGLAQAEAQNEILFQIEHQVEARQHVRIGGTPAHGDHGTSVRSA